MKTTIIEILKDISEGKTPPKKIMFGADIYNYVEEEQDYKHEKLNDWIFEDYIISHILNDELEILETTITYKPDKIEKLGFINNTSDASDLVALRNMQWENNQKFYRKINEIIDHLEGE